MSEEPRSATTYRVMVELPRPTVEGEEPLGLPTAWLILGDFAASNPKKAVEDAIEQQGTPAEQGATAVAIPLGNWHAFPVGREVKPVYKIGDKLPVDHTDPLPADPPAASPTSPQEPLGMGAED